MVSLIKHPALWVDSATRIFMGTPVIITEMAVSQFSSIEALESQCAEEEIREGCVSYLSPGCWWRVEGQCT